MQTYLQHWRQHVKLRWVNLYSEDVTGVFEELGIPGENGVVAGLVEGEGA